MDELDYTRRLAELIVRVGANVQPGQIVSIGSEPGKEPLTRAIAEVAYEQGAKFVDLTVFDAHIKRARLLHADPETLDYVPPWYGERILALGEHHAARISLTGPVAPHIMDGIEPALLGRDMLLPSRSRSSSSTNARRTGPSPPARPWLGPCWCTRS